MNITFFVHGSPAPAGSKTAFCLKKDGRYTGRAIVVDASGKKGKQWRESVSHNARLAMGANPPFIGALQMTIIFHMPRPQKHYLKSGLRPDAPEYHITRPDCTKLLRAAEDAMTGIVYEDDGQIVEQTVKKTYGGIAGCTVWVEEL